MGCHELGNWTAYCRRYHCPVESDCKLEQELHSPSEPKQVIINLGCAKRIIPGAFNCDLVKGPGVDKVFDAGGPWPWPFNDDSIDRIDASHILEHVQDIDTCMKEAHRVLKIGGIFDIRVPFGPIGTQVNDELHHVHAFYTTSLNPYCQDNGANTSLDYKHQNALFKLESLEVTRIFWQRERLGKILGKWIEKPHTFPIGIPQEIHWLLRKVG